MEKKKLLVLSGIFLALFLFVVLVERHQPTSEEAAKARRNLVTLPADEVTDVAIERPDLPPVSLKREKERWTLATAPGGAADKQTVDTLLADLGRLETLGEPRRDFDPKEYGLDAPKATVTLTKREGAPVKITFGQPLPGVDATAAAEGGRMAAVKYAPMATLVKPVDEFRSKTLLDVPTTEVTTLSVAKGTVKATLEREMGKDGPGPWRLTEPVKDLAAQSFVDQLLSDLAAARVSEFPAIGPSDLPRVGLMPPTATISVKKGSETVSTVSIGAAKADAAGKIFARRDGVVVVTDDRLAEDLAKEFSAFRETKLLPVDPWSVARVSFASGTLRTGAERVEGEWRSAGHAIPATAAEDLLDRIARAEAKAFVPRREYAAHGIADRRGKMAAAPLATITIQRESDSPAEEIAFYPAAPLAGAPVVAAEVTGRADALLVPAATVDDVKALALKLRNAETTPPKGKPTAAPAPAAAPPATR